MSKNKNKLAAAKPGVPAQRYLDIAEIKEDVVVMKDGTIRAVLLVSSINFALKSMDEQNAIVQAYMQFLNGLDFFNSGCDPIAPHEYRRLPTKTTRLRKRSEKRALRRQIGDYLDYVKQLVDLGEIMQKRFYVVVPLNPATDQQKGFFSRLGEILTPSIAIRITDEKFLKSKELLMLRVNQIMSGLQSMSLNAAMLDTQSLIELYYTVYNPELFESQRMTDVSKLQLEG